MGWGGVSAVMGTWEGPLKGGTFCLEARRSRLRTDRSAPAAPGLTLPRIAMHVAQHQIINLLKTLFACI